MRLNLLPWRETRLIKQQLMFCFCLLLTLIFLAIAMHQYQLYIFHKNNKQEIINNILVSKINTLKISIGNKNYLEEYRLDTQRIQLLKEIQLNQIIFWNVFLQLQKLIPQEISLDKIDWALNILKLQGRCLYPEKVSRLVEKLQISQLFTAIDLKNISQLESKNITQFSLELHGTMDKKP